MLSERDRKELARLIARTGVTRDDIISDYINSYVERSTAKYGTDLGPRSLQQAAAFIADEIDYDAAQPDHGGLL